jgi:hypothetical protein
MHTFSQHKKHKSINKSSTQKTKTPVLLYYRNYSAAFAKPVLPNIKHVGNIGSSKQGNQVTNISCFITNALLTSKRTPSSQPLTSISKSRDTIRNGCTGRPKGLRSLRYYPRLLLLPKWTSTAR